VVAHAHERTDLKHTDYIDRTDYGFILTLFCMVLALVVAILVFKPTPVGAGVTSEITVVPPTL
jgi:hypothetical protein